MITNILCQVVISLVTNVTNSVLEMPLDTNIIYVPEHSSYRAEPARRPQIQRLVGTNVFERATITWVYNGVTNTCTSDRLIYSASQVLRLKETWEAGPLTINQQ